MDHHFTGENSVRGTVVALLALTAPLLGVGTYPAHAATGTADSGWEPAPSAPWDTAAGVRCDFPVHAEPVVDEVERRVVTTHPDGSPERVLYRGDLVVRITNTDTGAFHDADASGTAAVDHRADGSQFWSVLGPVLVGFAENGGTLARGVYLIDGVYTLDISSAGYKDVTMVHGSVDDLCARVD
ncbi:hypothetical protein OG705_02410 [Streptomyces sp. NBC_00838]|uniref:hypothetical protein n=1 Tax=Streptomyces sp. NBC_00838 TaxID=2903680 RepID=UPI003869DAE2|nr:hypothetical protein OG705_02410 [Streptomyces sp. NBC_00838]